jgi:hypothetical protein
MTESIGPDLTLTQLPRCKELGEYDWFDIEHAGTQVGRSRCRIEPDRLTVFSIMIYPEHEKHGYARTVIEHFKHQYGVIVADRVRYTARDFWAKVGFLPDLDGNYIWHRSAEP